MPQLASISINDGESTPVAHVFTPSGIQNGLATLRNQDATTPQGAEILTLEYRQPANGTAAHRILLKGKFPTEATVDGQDQVVRLSSFEVAFNESQLSTAQERKNHRVMVANLLLNSVVEDMIEGPEMAW